MSELRVGRTSLHGRFLKYAVSKQLLIRPAAPDISSQFETISYSTRILGLSCENRCFSCAAKASVFAKERPHPRSRKAVFPGKQCVVTIVIPSWVSAPKGCERQRISRFLTSRRFAAISAVIAASLFIPGWKPVFWRQACA
jgi:hypothetical protein